MSLISEQDFKRLNHLSNWTSVRYILQDYFLIAAAIEVSLQFNSWMATLFATIFIASRQHSLLIGIHDAAHRRLFTNKFWNDLLSNFLIAWPLLFKMEAYRLRHLAHHKHTNTSNDPDFRRERFPESQGEFLRMLFRDMLGYGVIEQLKELKSLKAPAYTGIFKWLRLSFYIALVTTLFTFSLWKTFALYWLLPAFLWLRVILKIRMVADHTGVETRPDPFNTRTVVPSLLDRILWAPRKCSYHLEHHYYASVPSYNLHELHQLLMKNQEYKSQAHVTSGFLGLLSEFPKEPTPRTCNFFSGQLTVEPLS